MPRVSVVVSSYRRPDGLARLLDALAAQTLGPTSFEVVAVDNGSGPETAAVLRAEAARGRLALKAIRHERTRGPAGGRNAGWRAATGPLIAFTDDDCAPAPGWLEALLAESAAQPEAIVQGRTLPAEQLRGVLCRSVRVERAGPQYETCNILYPRPLLERLGGFDESFGVKPAGEDTDLAWRAIAAGTPTRFAPEALVRHEVVRLTPVQGLREAGRWGDTALLYKRHPEARQMLYARVFWDVWHYLLVRSALALLLPRPLRRVLHRAHLKALRNRARALGAGPGTIPYLLAYDLVGVGALLRAAVRYRTPLL